MEKYSEIKTFYRIYDKIGKEYVHAIVGAGTNRTQTYFSSVREAREFNCHGLFKNKERYEIHEFKAEISSDCVDVDPINEEDRKELERKKQEEQERDERLKLLYALICGDSEQLKECLEQLK